MKQSPLPLAIRPYDKVIDEDFLFTTFLKSYRNSSFARAIPTPIYFYCQRKRIERLIENKNVEILIATDPENTDVIYGYAIIESGCILHYVFVKNNFRMLGIASKLLANLPSAVQYTHKAPDINLERLLQEDTSLLEWIYNPYFFELGA